MWRSQRRRIDGEEVRLVSRRKENRYSRWLVAAPSCALRSLGLPGDGIYAARRFTAGQMLGEYGGREVCRCPDGDVLPQDAARVDRLLHQGHNKLLMHRTAAPGEWVVVDGEGGGPPYLQLTNDPRGTGRGANVQLTDTGWIRATQEIPAFDPARTLAENAASEILLTYGDGYWEHWGEKQQQQVSEPARAV